MPDAQQLALAEQALGVSAEAIAGQAECLADEMQEGSIADRGGPEALRLLAAILRAMRRDRHVRPA